MRSKQRWAVCTAILTACLIVETAAAQQSDRIGAGDLLMIGVRRVPELTTSVQVAADGTITLPYVGALKVAGLTELEAAGLLAQTLSQGILRNPQVSVHKSGISFRPETPGRTADMQMEIIPLQNARAETLSAALTGVSSPGGTVNYDPDTNSLIIVDTPAALQNITNVVARLDQMQSQLTQVRIEAKIAEVRVGALKELGIRWWAKGTEGLGGFYPLPTQDQSLISSRGGVSPLAGERIGGTGTQSGAPFGNSLGRSFVDQMFDRRLNVPVQVPLPGQTFFGFTNEHVDIGALLDALVANNDAELLANPMTMTVNHKPSVIKMVDEVPYTEFGTEITGATSFSTKFLDMGIVLNVTPHVYQDDRGPYVKMDLDVEVSFPVGSNAGVPIRSVRSTQSQPSVRDGQTLVIGGILREDERTFDSKVPGLGNLPVIGRLFRHKEDVKFRSELMVFVTPTVHHRPDDITWDQMIDISKNLRDRELIPKAAIRREERKD